MHTKDALAVIQSSHNILLHLHPKPDEDSIGSALATYHALTSLGKKATVIQGDSVLPERFAVLPGYEHIVRKSYVDIDLADFDLFIIQDCGAKTLITRKQEVVFPPHLKTIIIDHHKTNDRYADINLIDTSRASTTEFLYTLFVEWGWAITPDIAACLYAGLFGDTGGFRYQSTTLETMRVAAKLVECYPDFSKLTSALENSNRKGKIYFDALALNSLETYANDTVAIASVSYADMQKKGIVAEDSDNNTIANMFLTVKEWKVGIMLTEKSIGEIGINLRSKDDVDVSLIAQKLGGGGHKNASGARLMMSLEDAKKKVIEAIGDSVK